MNLAIGLSGLVASDYGGQRAGVSDTIDGSNPLVLTVLDQRIQLISNNLNVKCFSFFVSSFGESMSVEKSSMFSI